MLVQRCLHWQRALENSYLVVACCCLGGVLLEGKGPQVTLMVEMESRGTGWLPTALESVRENSCWGLLTVRPRLTREAAPMVALRFLIFLSLGARRAKGQTHL